MIKLVKNCYTEIPYCSGFSIIRTVIICIRTLGRWLTSLCFRQQRLQSLEFCYRRKQNCCTNDFSRMLQHLFHPVRDLDHNLQRPSKLSEAANAVVCCITAWQIKRWGKQDHSWVQSLACDWLNVAFALFCQPCPRFQTSRKLLQDCKNRFLFA